jgi:hypothetical protein
VAFIKLLHVMGGIYIWEYFTTLWFEWQVITGKRKYRWTIWLYSGCRLTALIAIIAIFAGFDATEPINCKVWLTTVFLFAYLAFVFASALIVLRILAIWERNVFISTIAISAWLVTITFYMRSLVRADATWNPSTASCLVLNTERTIGPVTVTLVEDFILLILMLSGLRRYGETGMFGLWRFLYHQGLFWLALVTIAEIPPTVFVILNLNEYLNLMFQVPELIMMAIGASRIYRRLADYTCTAEFNWNDEKSWAIMGGAMSDSTGPATIQFHHTTQMSQRPPIGDPEMSHTETYLTEDSHFRKFDKRGSCTTTTAATEHDSPV